ncbi:MAG: UDP-N-acetylglucosamine--N-acetylmuramyl-(pentapeptide) pyrophosphoryl-undecaprenol N-acetylglucosamine transferase, partial [Planctomycetales bacterium]|nr:UDP-N-acetylglucosamine--N-acetylmuramyl-(pentapeptide) pyrophosphoryl-undecaprenol N-acetylglucosamine transferase [Planctomycetales bacterium]
VQALERLQERKPDLVIIHQTGRADLERTRRAYESRGVKARVEPYLFRMGEAYQMADLVLCRAGATTIAEITAIGKAAILIPYPYATHAHQLQNALLLGEAGAAVVIEEKDLRGPELADKIIELLQDPDRLRTMAQKSKALGKSDA